MHCPTCRHDNPATTRFCRACGAVLVESAPDGGRRRVLRPWGMQRTAPPTISPDMLDLAPAGVPARVAHRDPAFRLDFRVVGVVVAALVAAVWINGNARPDGGATHYVDASVDAGSPVYVSATAPPIVQEARLEAPPLLDAPPATTQPSAATRRVAAIAALPVRARADGANAIPVIVAAASRESELDDDRGEVPASPVARVPPMPSPAADRWQSLRGALAQCGAVNGAIGRAMCEQEARLAHCDGYWGLVSACPTTRSEFGQ
jgi:hypothetical protein